MVDLPLLPSRLGASWALGAICLLVLVPGCTLISDDELADKVGTPANDTAGADSGESDSATDTGIDTETGSDTDSGDDSGDVGSPGTDDDGDGFSEDDGDCNDANNEVSPTATETWYDGIDADCSGSSDYDQDGDGFERDAECDDADASISPSAVEAWYNGLDENCDGNDGDQDEDGYCAGGYVGITCAFGDGDCADDPTTPVVAINGFPDLGAEDIYPATTETWYDGIDENCAGDADFDQDRDGYAIDVHADTFGTYGEDCSDVDPATHPGAADPWYDGFDTDCSGNDDYDADADGFESTRYGGDDCDDENSAVSPAADELCNGADDNCDGGIDIDPVDASIWYLDRDADAYGDDATSSVGCTQPIAHVAAAGDCNDLDVAVNPGAVEDCATEGDDDCDGTLDAVDATNCTSFYADNDGDGDGIEPAVCACVADAGYPTSNGEDCDDGDPSVGASRAWYYDADRDGYGDPATGLTMCVRPSGYLANGSDCDDADDAISPGADEVWGTGVDENCDGTVDEDEAITGAWYGTFAMEYVYDGSYCAGTYTCSGSATGTGSADGAGGATIQGSYSCTPVFSGGYYYGYCYSTTYAPSGEFEVESTGSTYFSGSLESGSCTPYGFPYTYGDLSTSGSVSATGILLGFGGRGCPAGDASTITGEVRLSR